MKVFLVNQYMICLIIEKIYDKIIKTKIEIPKEKKHF